MKDAYPLFHPETEAVRQHFEAGHFCVPECRACKKTHWYPRAFCPFCFSEDIELKASPGDATVYSFSAAGTSPTLVIAYVELADGLRLMTNIVDVDVTAMHIGMKVRIVWRTVEGGRRMPFYTAAEERLTE